MVLAVADKVVTTVGAILKTLECPICLELLKTPVSAGCGHFFCRYCVSGILQSNYRAPCPLCKRSFTRRSVQTASQRQSVISAARALAETCRTLTGANFTALDNLVRESRKSTETKTTPVPLKKFKSLNENTENATSRKRKSVENEDTEQAAEKTTSGLSMGKSSKLSTGDESSNKRSCPPSENSNSSDDLPTLEEVVQRSFLQANSSAVQDTAVEKPLSIFPTDKMANLKTYLAVNRKKDSSENRASKSEEKEECTDFISKNADETPSVMEFDSTTAKNKINALKNKTNEVHLEKNIQSDPKLAQVKASTEKAEATVQCKENENISSPSEVPSSIPSPQKMKQKLRRKKKKPLPNSPNAKVSNKKDCFTLNEVNLPSVQPDKTTEDPFKSLGLTDTAVSVNSVRSPLAAKTLLTVKSPGWSRVKEVKKDFKVKKFTSLHVGKISPHTFPKTNIVSDQGEKSEIPVDDKNAGEDAADENAQTCDHLSPKSEKTSRFSTEANLEEQQMQLDQNDNDPDIINTVGEPLPEAHIQEVDYSTADNQKALNSNSNNIINPLKAGEKIVESNIANSKHPTVSITSNSIICANFTGANDKVSRQNVVKTKKIVCEIPNNSSFNTEASLKNENILSTFLQNNSSNVNIPISSEASEITHGLVSLPPQISGYQAFHKHSVVNEDDGFQYVEQSQQTSQMLNFDLQSSLYNKMHSFIEHPALPKPANVAKTKVVKRACLTLEEIQDCFFKSEHSNQAETLCSVPFLDGQFKLHIGVSDDTLNVSVLKVIDSVSSTDNAQSLLMNKYIQTSNSFLPLPSVLPSSNAASESSQPDSAANPFPYLNKIPVSLSSDQDVPQNEHLFKGQEDMASNKCDGNYPTVEPTKMPEEEINENNMEISEIVHFPAEPVTVNNEPLQLSPMSAENIPQNEDCEAINDSPSKEFISLSGKISPGKSNISMECDLQVEQEKFPSEQNQQWEVFSSTKPSIHSKIEKKVIQLDSDEFSDSDKEESLRKLEKCVQQGNKSSGKKVSRLSLKKKPSLKRVQVLESSDESDVETSVCNEIKGNDEPSKNKSPTALSPALNLHLSTEPEKKVFKSPIHHSVHGETPSTDSLLSENASEKNASEIIMEIEDLSDKIKSLEEKLKQSGYSDALKSMSLPHADRSRSTLADRCTSAPAEMPSDSEDSFDLFPQSVPPTPPNRV